MQNINSMKIKFLNADRPKKPLNVVLRSIKFNKKHLQL